ncbi:hypothetical protein [Bacillus sp. N1-1]|uniref:hypothetical protein n=1 Tax=Bacillus sp. N1-1 TaxID=2682541 RepID=UPI0013187D01|nr:hypothetical protein [Bacillus sp. N1-1]QHA91320.1 hypothetical protein GNK04_07740 [Bacillus sp. N1-1]
MKGFNSLTYKEITIRYAVLTIFLSTTIFMVKYNLPLWAYLICMGNATTGVGLNLVKWLRGKARRISSKGDIIRTSTISFMAILLLIVPFHYSVVMKLVMILALFIVNLIECIKLKNKYHLS